jgi:hypothetical protein
VRHPPRFQAFSQLTCIRYRTTLFLTAPLLIAVGIQASELLVPREVRNHLDTLEKDWDDFKKKRAELDKELGRNVQVPDLSKITRGGNSRPSTSAPIWIPIPIWTTLKKAPEYKPTDPEWKEFLKLEQDRDRVKKLKGEVARTIATGVLDGLPPPVERAWGFDGKVSYDSGQIDFVFPFSPPNIYERPGLLITASGIKWTSQELPDERGRRFYRIFHPTVFAQAFWAGGKAFYKYHYTYVKKWISETLSEKPKTPQTKTVSRRFKGFSAAEQAQLKKAFTISTSSILIDPQDSAELLKVLLPPPAPKSAIEAAVNAYKRKHTHMQVAKWKECPRGGCYLTGHVDIRGTKATIRVSVKAIYIPSQDTFLGSPTIGEAIVMPKLSMMTADKLKLEKLKTENEKLKPEKDTALTGKERLRETVKTINAKRVDELARRLEKERVELKEEEESRSEKAKTESQTNLETTTNESQQKIETAKTESLKTIQEAKGEALGELEKCKTETESDTKPKEEKMKIDAAKKDSGQGPPDEK